MNNTARNIKCAMIDVANAETRLFKLLTDCSDKLVHIVETTHRVRTELGVDNHNTLAIDIALLSQVSTVYFADDCIEYSHSNSFLTIPIEFLNSDELESDIRKSTIKEIETYDTQQKLDIKNLARLREKLRV